MEVLEKILRYETKLERQMFRAMAQLEWLQRIRKGEAVPAPLAPALGGENRSNPFQRLKLSFPHHWHRSKAGDVPAGTDRFSSVSGARGTPGTTSRQKDLPWQSHAGC